MRLQDADSIQHWYEVNETILATLEGIVEDHLIAPLQKMETEEPESYPPGFLYKEDFPAIYATMLLSASEMDISSKEHKEGIEALRSAAAKCRNAVAALNALNGDDARLIDAHIGKTCEVTVKAVTRHSLIQALNAYSGEIDNTAERFSKYEIPGGDLTASELLKACQNAWRETLYKEPTGPGIRTNKDTGSRMVIAPKLGTFGNFVKAVFEALGLDPQRAQSAHERLRSFGKK